jgi:hypothetical protein
MILVKHAMASLTRKMLFCLDFLAKKSMEKA